MPIIVQWIILVLNMIGVVWISGYLDANSTMMFLKRGSGSEANPLVRWLISKMGGKLKYLVWAKVLWALLISVTLTYFGLHYLGLAGTCAALTALNAIYYVFVVNRNYRIARGD